MRQLAEEARKKELKDYRDRCMERLTAFRQSDKRQAVFAPEEDEALRFIMCADDAVLQRS